jgi:hypothetical protein
MTLQEEFGVQPFVDVLLQAAPAAALPYLQDCVQACNSLSASAVDAQGLHSVAERIVDAWEGDAGPAYRDRQKESDRSQMLALLGEMGDAPLLEHFITGGELGRPGLSGAS